MIEQKAAELGIRIPQAPKPGASYVPTVRTGNLVYVSGQGPTQEGTPQYLGRVGAEVSRDDGYQAARICVLNLLAALKQEVGDLDAVRRIVKVNGYVRSAPNFDQQHIVMNGASDLIEQIFGDRGKHARTSVAVNELPNGIPVEVELIAEVE